MKKIIAYIAALFMLTLCLSGCGAADTHIDSSMETARPTSTPYSSMYNEPDIEDGIVEDGDGIIGNEQGSAANEQDNDSGIQKPDSTANVSPKPDMQTEK